MNEYYIVNIVSDWDKTPTKLCRDNMNEFCLQQKHDHNRFSFTAAEDGINNIKDLHSKEPSQRMCYEMYARN